MNLINFLYGSSALGFGALVPLYAIRRYGISTVGSGTLLTSRAVGIILIAGLAAMTMRRTGYRWPMVVGFTITAGGLLVMAVSPVWFTPRCRSPPRFWRAVPTPAWRRLIYSWSSQPSWSACCR